jgi:hypothetical protein
MTAPIATAQQMVTIFSHNFDKKCRPITICAVVIPAVDPLSGNAIKANLVIALRLKWSLPIKSFAYSRKGLFSNNK